MKNKQRGFTFLELMIAMFLLTVGILGTSKMLKNIARASRKSSDQIVAAYLAQEGIELVRNTRDNNWYDESGGEGNWLGYNYSCFEISILENQNEGIDCSDNYSELNNLYLREINIGDQYRFFYNYKRDTDIDEGEITPYKRKIEIDHIQIGKIARITSTVYWGNRDEDKIVAKTTLYNWK